MQAAANLEAFCKRCVHNLAVELVNATAAQRHNYYYWLSPHLLGPRPHSHTSRHPTRLLCIYRGCCGSTQQHNTWQPAKSVAYSSHWFQHTKRCPKLRIQATARSSFEANATYETFPSGTSSSRTNSDARSSQITYTVPDTRKRVVVVGGGWAGFGAAKHLAEQGYAVKLIEASKNPGGLSGGFRTSSGKVVEAGKSGRAQIHHQLHISLKFLTFC